MVKTSKNRKFRGGDWASDLYNSAVSLGNRVRNKVNVPSSSSNTSFMSSSSPSFMSSYPSFSSAPQTNTGVSYPQGGKRRRMRGGYHANSPMSIASYASPFSGEGTTARPLNWVGGRTKKRSHSKRKHTKRRR